VEAVPEGGMFVTSGILILVLRALYIQILAHIAQYRYRS
jgi:hypothetical protein